MAKGYKEGQRVRISDQFMKYEEEHGTDQDDNDVDPDIVKLFTQLRGWTGVIVEVIPTYREDDYLVRIDKSLPSDLVEYNSEVSDNPNDVTCAASDLEAY